MIDAGDRSGGRSPTGLYVGGDWGFGGLEIEDSSEPEVRPSWTAGPSRMA